MANIEFHSEKISFKFLKAKKTAQWLELICKKEGRKLNSLTYVLCSDEFLRKLNLEFLNHNAYTDILSFPDPEGKKIGGEIYISIPRVRENAKNFSQPFDGELRRVMAHGLLHFLGYKDKTARDKARMRQKEEACLSLWA
jgi:probable rRNA maturation factor